jgi:hypothetical protein
MPRSHIYVELSFDTTDPAALMAWVKDNLPTSGYLTDEDGTEGVILAAAMAAVDVIPGLECYGGSVHQDHDDRRDVEGRVPVFHRHVNEHAHPSGGKQHMHYDAATGTRTTGRHYFGPDDVIPARALHEPEGGF